MNGINNLTEYFLKYKIPYSMTFNRGYVYIEFDIANCSKLDIVNITDMASCVQKLVVICR